MKRRIFFILLLANSLAYGQQLQLHYDFRHTIDPQVNPQNFFTLNFEYFKDNDTTGSFLLKIQSDFNGENSNLGKSFIQISKNLRYWEPKVYLSFSYSGGLGIAPPAFGYYIANSFGLGIAYPFQWQGTWFSTEIGYRYNAFPKGSHDLQLTIYFWKGLMNYKLSVSGSVVAWTQNQDLGTNFTQDLNGKKFLFFADPQIWLKVWKKVSIGTRLNCFYNILTNVPSFQLYPTIAVKQEF